MGLAPTPGVSRRADAASAAQRIIVVRMVRTDETYRLAPNNLPLDQRSTVLKQVGVSFDVIMTSSDGMLSTAMVVWLARRMNGERSLSWAQFQRTWPDDLVEADLDCWAEDPQGRRLDEDGLIVDGPVEVDPFAEPVEDPEPVGIDDPQS